MCKCVLPPGDNPIAVNKYIIYHIVKYNEIYVTRNTGITVFFSGKILQFGWSADDPYRKYAD